MSNLINFVLAVASNPKAMKEYKDAVDPTKTAARRTALVKKIRTKYNLKPAEWKILAATYASPKAQAAEIQNYLQKEFPGLRVDPGGSIHVSGEILGDI